MKSLHLCIITGQPLANLIPLMQEKPDLIVLMYSDDEKMSSAAKAFKNTLKKAGFSSSQIQLKSGLPTYHFDDIGEYMIDLYAELSKQFPESQLTWNATGGTKQMALAIWDVLDRKKDRVIYADTRDGYLEELTPSADSVELESLLTPELYLNAVGKIRRSAQSTDQSWCDRAIERKELTRHLGNNVKELGGLIDQFNRQLNSNVSDVQKLTIKRVGSQWKKALYLLEQHDVVDTLEEGEYNLMRSESARYLTGGWLEEYVWHVIKDQRVDHVECSLKFGDLENRKKGQDNEIDAFVLHRNRVLLVECKSGSFGREGDKDNQVIYKLDSLGLHAGGTHATRLLVSAQALQHDTREGRRVDTKARASATNIYTLEADELKQLGKKIREWKESGQWT